jgi:hypothetical protein
VALATKSPRAVVCISERIPSATERLAGTQDATLDVLVDAIARKVAAKVRVILAADRDSNRIPPRWLDLDGAAQIMNTTRDAVRGMARAKLFPVKKMGGRVMVDIRDLEQAFADRTEFLQ